MEQAFWHWIRDGGMPGTWRRVETRLDDGFPDCIVHYQGRTFLVELKAVRRWQDDFGLRPEQAVFFLTWPGEAYVLVRIGGKPFWFKDVVAIRKRKATLDHVVSGPFNK